MAKVTENVLGHVDGIAGNALTGWIANLDDPGKAELVVCQGSRGRLAFRAWHPREDVSNALGRPGRFGFSIPSRALSALGDVVTVSSSRGLLLTNGQAVKVHSDTLKSEEIGQPLVFLHLPKTAGTTFRSALIEGLEPARRLFLYAPPFGVTLAELASLPREQKAEIALIVGHARFGAGALLGRDVRYLTILRDPIARLRSHLFHHANAGTRFYQAGAEIPLHRALAQPATEEFDNLAVRYIAGVHDGVVPLGQVDEHLVDLALSNVDRHFVHVGFDDCLEDSATKMSELLGREIVLPEKQNVSPSRVSDVNLGSSIDWDRVACNNRYDLLLFHRLRERRLSSI